MLPSLSLSLQPYLGFTKIMFAPPDLSWISLLAQLGFLFYSMLASSAPPLLWSGHSVCTFESVRLCLVQGQKYSHLFINTKHIISFRYRLQKRLIFQFQRNTFRKAASLLH